MSGSQHLQSSVPEIGGGEDEELDDFWSLDDDVCQDIRFSVSDSGGTAIHQGEQMPPEREEVLPWWTTTSQTRADEQRMASRERRRLDVQCKRRSDNERNTPVNYGRNPLIRDFVADRARPLPSIDDDAYGGGTRTTYDQRLGEPQLQISNASHGVNTQNKFRLFSCFRA